MNKYLATAAAVVTLGAAFLVAGIGEDSRDNIPENVRGALVEKATFAEDLEEAGRNVYTQFKDCAGIYYVFEYDKGYGDVPTYGTSYIMVTDDAESTIESGYKENKVGFAVIHNDQAPADLDDIRDYAMTERLKDDDYLPRHGYIVVPVSLQDTGLNEALQSGESIVKITIPNTDLHAFVELTQGVPEEVTVQDYPRKSGFWTGYGVYEARVQTSDEVMGYAPSNHAHLKR